MSTKSLKTHLVALRRELAAAKALDPDTRKLLDALAEDIDGALDTGEPDYKSLRKRVEGATLKFEAAHPRFASILSDITDTLAKLGF
ncbi:MAG TPA: DUF4404 family protein [Gammaproteobacteria bacterium]|jgi:hypothetical protein